MDKPDLHLNSAVPFGVHTTGASAAECSRACAAFEALLDDPEHFPCSFALNGVFRKGFVGFSVVDRTTEEQPFRRTDTLTLRRGDGLECRIVAALYPRHAAYEWTLWFANRGAADSVRISRLSAADLVIPGKKPRLRGILGDARNENYGSGDGTVSPTYGMNNQPYDIALGLGTPYQMNNVGGCSCNHEFPYFTLQLSEGGTVIAIGWPGQWKAEMYADRSGVHFTDGQQYLDTVLHPGEQLRTPMTTFLWYDGADADRQTNLWRTFMMECNMPRRNGSISLPILSGTSFDTGMMTLCNEQNQIDQIEAYRRCGLTLDNWWMDAGWYTTDVADGAPKVMDDYAFTGTWKPREADFPTHLAAVSDAMHATGGSTLLWFEPERCGLPPADLKEDGSTLKREWLLKGYTEYTRERPGNTTVQLPISMVDIGDPEAYSWLKERIYRVLREGKIDIYREDHNIRPLDFWKQTDGPGREGMTENRYITAHLRLWDEIRADFGDMILDSCASGGRRNDLESMRRAVPMHYTDFFIPDLPRRQAVHRSLFQWFPFFKANCVPGTFGDTPARPIDPFTLCSGMVAMPMICFDTQKPDSETVHSLQSFVGIWRRLNKYFYADYYPLLDWNIDEGSPLAWQFIDPAESAGFVQVFRRGMTEEAAFTVPMKGLQPDTLYRVTEQFTGQTQTLRGDALMETGLPVSISRQPGAALLQFEPVRA